MAVGNIYHYLNVYLSEFVCRVYVYTLPTYLPTYHLPTNLTNRYLLTTVNNRLKITSKKKHLNLSLVYIIRYNTPSYTVSFYYLLKMSKYLLSFMYVRIYLLNDKEENVEELHLIHVFECGNTRRRSKKGESNTCIRMRKGCNYYYFRDRVSFYKRRVFLCSFSYTQHTLCIFGFCFLLFFFSFFYLVISRWFVLSTQNSCKRYNVYYNKRVK